MNIEWTEKDHFKRRKKWKKSLRKQTAQRRRSEKKSAAIRIQSAQTQLTKTKRTQKMIFMIRKIHVEQSMNTIVHFRPFDSLIRFSALFFTFVFSSVFFFLCVLRFNFFSLFLISFFFYYSVRPFRRRHNAFRNSFRCLSSIKHRKASWICVANKQCVFVRFSLPSRSFISRPFLIFSLLTLFSVGVFLFAFFLFFFFVCFMFFCFVFVYQNWKEVTHSVLLSSCTDSTMCTLVRARDRQTKTTITTDHWCDDST